MKRMYLEITRKWCSSDAKEPHHHKKCAMQVDQSWSPQHLPGTVLQTL